MARGRVANAEELGNPSRAAKNKPEYIYGGVVVERNTKVKGLPALYLA
jgi:hypothetical protein